MFMLKVTMEKIFGLDGVLAHHLERYETRTGQLQMAEAVAALLNQDDESLPEEGLFASSLIVEAGTGLGKTLAYLIPAALSRRKVVISTATRNLQDQILEHEIPFIQKYVDPTLTALCVKGKQNYLCLYRRNQYRAAGQGTLFSKKDSDQIDIWIQSTRYGDRAEIKWLRSNSKLWQKICCLPHFCLGSDCPDWRDCFLNRLRRDAAACRLLVVNHHLLFSDLAVRRGGYGEVLPRYDAVLFDEAHHVEKVATTFFGLSFSQYQVLDLIGDIERAARTELGESDEGKISVAARGLAENVEVFISHFPTKRGRFPLAGILESQPGLQASLDTLLAGFLRLSTRLEKIDGELWDQMALRCRDLHDRLEAITAETFGDLDPAEVRFIHWYERRERTLTLSASPVDVAEDLERSLYLTVKSCLFTSATLASGGSFNYFKERTGLDPDTESLVFPSPFDYENRTLLYIPENEFPVPGNPGYKKALHERIAKLVEVSSGRSLVLFTSYEAMESAFAVLRDQLDFPLLKQGSAPRRSLLESFSGEVASVLFAVASFWEGVDIPGESLSSVIIDKLPFEVPSDPVIMARMERVRAQGGNPFFDFQIPRAILTLRQGVGRLMRGTGDYGVISLLDSRLYSKGYGRRFLRSLPPSPICRSLDEVRSFFVEQPTR